MASSKAQGKSLNSGSGQKAKQPNVRVASSLIYVEARLIATRKIAEFIAIRILITSEKD